MDRDTVRNPVPRRRAGEGLAVDQRSVNDERLGGHALQAQAPLSPASSTTKDATTTFRPPLAS